MADVLEESLADWLKVNATPTETTALVEKRYTSWDRLVAGFRGVRPGACWVAALDQESAGILAAFLSELPDWQPADAKCLLLKIGERYVGQSGSQPARALSALTGQSTGDNLTGFTKTFNN